MIERGGPNHKSHAMTSSKFFNKEPFCGAKLLQNGRSEAVACWHLTLVRRHNFTPRTGGIGTIVPKLQRWSRGHKARGQGQGHKKIRGQGQGQPFRGQIFSRPSTAMLKAKAKDQGHKRKCHKFFRRPPKKKRSSQKFFKRSPQKNVFQKIFQALHKILTIQKILLSSSRGQANFRGLEASRPRPRTSKSKTSSRTPPLLNLF